MYNFDANSVQWSQSYLSNRSQRVQVESKFSDEILLGSYGVSQGSVLGPFIFIIFCNDFATSGICGESILNADDKTTLLVTVIRAD